MRKKYPPDPKNPKTFFTAFKKGMHELPDAMAEAAGRDKMRTGVDGDLADCEETTARGAWTLSDGSSLTGDAVVLATESWAAEPLARCVDADIADALAAIPASSSATVSFAFNEDEIGIDINAFGVLCPAKEKARLLAATLSSTKWPGRAPAGKVLIRAFVGGPQNQKIMEKSDEEITQIAEDGTPQHPRDQPGGQDAVLAGSIAGRWACRSTRWATSTTSPRSRRAAPRSPGSRSAAAATAASVCPTASRAARLR